MIIYHKGPKNEHVIVTQHFIGQENFSVLISVIVLLECSDLLSSSNGIILGNLRVIGSKRIHVCNAGYRLSTLTKKTSETLVCSQSGAWEPDIHECVRKYSCPQVINQSTSFRFLPRTFQGRLPPRQFLLLLRFCHWNQNSSIIILQHEFNMFKAHRLRLFVYAT